MQVAIVREEEMGRQVDFDTQTNDDSLINIAWEFPSATGEWQQTERGGVYVAGPGPLTERGRQALLKRFDLLEWADDLPLGKISIMSPEALDEFKR